MKVSEIKKNPNNPRVIKDDKFQQLVKSIKDFPEMMELRPMVVNEDMVLLGGNMRLAAIESLGMKEVPDSWVKKAADLTPEQQKEFVIKDNVGFGVWDWEVLANEWEAEELNDWGLNVPSFDIDDAEEGETIHINKSLQVIPKKEYLIIYADEDSEDWDDLKSIFKCKTVRQGGCSIGSTSDKATTGLERVFDVETFKKRVLNGV